MAHIFQARYTEHNDQLINQFMKWYLNGKYVDVTIHAGGQRILAHKVILAANSPFFNGVFMDTKKDMTHLYFTDVPFESMKSLIEYIYCGTLVVERKFAAACLQLGDSLRVKGISDVTVEDVIKEPLPVTEKMHNFINTVINQCSSPAGNVELVEEELIDKTKAVEQGALAEKSVFESTKEATTIHFRQICDTTTEDQITSTNNVPNVAKVKKKIRKRKLHRKNLQSPERSQSQVVENCDQPTQMAEKPEHYRVPIEDESQLWVDTRNATKIPDHSDELKFNSNLFQNTDICEPVMPLESDDVSERKDSKIEPNDLGTKKRNAPNNEETQKEAKKKRVQKHKPIKIEKQFEELFGDNYLGIYRGELGESVKPEGRYVQIHPKKEYEQEAADEAWMHEIADLDKNLKRQDSTPCPPPEDVLKNGKVSFACSLCQRVYTHKSNYRRHYMVFHRRSAEPVFECSMCSKKFTRSDNRAHHLRKIHGLSNPTSVNSEDSIVCPICKKVFAYSSNREIHMQEIHGIRPENSCPPPVN